MQDTTTAGASHRGRFHLHTYLPQDRWRALVCGETLPDRIAGAALVADISGFTLLTKALVHQFGPRRGAEELACQLNRVYDALIAKVEKYGGSVVGFAGDAITCWFNEPAEFATPVQRSPALRPLPPASWQAAACALAMQATIQAFAQPLFPSSETDTLAIKAAIASGPARRFVVGDRGIQLLDVLAGNTLDRMAAAEQLASKGEVLIDEATWAHIENDVAVREWRTDADGQRFAVISDLRLAVGTWQLPIAPGIEDSLDGPESETLRPWLLPAVYERLRAGVGEFLTELRPAVAMFIKFTGIEYDADDDAGHKLDAYIHWVQQVLARHEGALLDITVGDKGSYLYASFGALTAHEDDPRRAVSAALELRTPPAELGYIRSFQIGLSRGVMRVGAYGGLTRRTYGAIGDEVNLASRLMQASAPGEILLSGRVQYAVANEFTFEPRPPLQMKGRAEPLPVFAVTGRSPRRAIRLQEPAYALPMVGRQAELQTISEKMDLALQEKGQVVGITAEAGLGKSRLVAEVIRLARRKGFVCYGGACQADGVDTAYLAWKPIWSAFFDVDPMMPQRKLLRNLRGEIEDRAPQRVNALPLLGQVLDLRAPIPDNDFTRALEPKTRKSALRALLEDCLKAAVREAPILLVMEDLQWVDALSYDLLEELARALAAFPLCIVLAYRPPQLVRLVAPRLEALPYFTRIELAELSPVECRQAIRAKLAQLYPARGGGVPPGLAEKLMARAQGNPFYLEELLNYLHDRGLDPADPATLDKIELPDSLHILVLSRIDQLDERQKTTLRVASIVGRLFRAAWLPGYYPPLGTLAQVKADLAELDRLDITPLATPEPELAYLFKHIITHEAAYESMPYATRAQLHERLAQYLETMHPVAPPLDALAYHYGQSANLPKKIEYLQKAGDAAQAAYANDAALDYYERLQPLLTAPAEQVGLQLKWGAVLELLGRWDEAEAHYRQALAYAKAQSTASAASLARCQSALGKLFRLRGDYPAAREWLEQAQAEWAVLDDPVGFNQTRGEISLLYLHQGDYSVARQRLEEGLALARTLGDRRGVARALQSLGNMSLDQGDYTAARALYEESLELRREMGDKPGISAMLNNLGTVSLHQGDYTAARALFEESLALCRGMGDKWGISSILNNLGLAAHYQSDYAAARAFHEESLALSREIGDKLGISGTLTNLGLVAYAQDDYAAARAFYDESLALGREMDEKREVAISLNNLGTVVYAQGDYAAARALFEECRDLSRTMGDKPNTAYALFGLGLIALAQTEAAAARALFEECRDLSRTRGDKPNTAYALFGLGLAALAQGETTTAGRLLAESLRLREEMGEKRGMASSLSGLAEAAIGGGDPRRAARLAGAAQALLASIEANMEPEARSVHERAAATARAALGEEAFATAWAEGQAMTMEQAVAYALSDV